MTGRWFGQEGGRSRRNGLPAMWLPDTERSAGNRLFPDVAKNGRATQKYLELHSVTPATEGPFRSIPPRGTAARFDGPERLFQIAKSDKLPFQSTGASVSNAPYNRSFDLLARNPLSGHVRGQLIASDVSKAQMSSCGAIASRLNAD